MILLKAEQFGKVLIEKEGNKETISVEYFDKAGGMLFEFKMNVKLELV